MCFRICPCCGAALDPGELCDCIEKAASQTRTLEDGADENHHYQDNKSNLFCQ